MIAAEATRLDLRPRRRLELLRIAVMVGVCVATPSHAALVPEWEADGLVVSTGNGERTSISVVPDQTGGVYLAWAERLTNKPWHIHSQHLLADGTPAANWIPSGMRLSTDRDTVSRPFAIADEQGGAWVAWYQNRFGIPSIRLSHLRAEGPAIDDYVRTLARYVMSAIAKQEKPMMASARDGSMYVMWQDSLLAGYYPKRVAVNRFLSTALQASGFGINGNTILSHAPHGVPAWFPKAGIVDSAGALVMPSTTVNHGGCHHDQCWDDFVFYATTTMFSTGIVESEYVGWTGGYGGLIAAVGSAGDIHSGFDLLVPATPDSYAVARFRTAPLARTWVTRLSQVGASDFDHRIVRTSDGGTFHTRLRPTSTGVELVGSAVQADGTPKTSLIPLGLYGSDSTSPLSAMVPNRHGGVVFLRSTLGPSGLDLWLGEYSGNPGLDQGLTPFAVASGDQKDGALGNFTNGAIYAAWVDARSGTQTVRVQRLVESLPTATQQVALHAVAASGAVRVRIESATHESLRLERAGSGGPWEFLAQLESGREGFVEFEDHPGLAASLLGYRATSRSGSSGETWIEWAPQVAFGLHGIASNAGTGVFTVSLSIDPNAPADLELFDLLGRRIDRVRIEAGIEGRQSFELGEAGLSSGVMLVRLSQAGKVATMRAVVLR